MEVFFLYNKCTLWSEIKSTSYYILLKYNIIKNTDLWIKISETIYDNREVIRSGWDEIEGNKLTELKIQLRYKF